MNSWIMYAAIALAVSVSVMLLYLFFSSKRRIYIAVFAAIALWPMCDVLTEALRQHYMQELLVGRQVSLFPFSRIAYPDPIPSGYVSPLEFEGMFKWAKQCIHWVIWLYVVVHLRRTLKGQ